MGFLHFPYQEYYIQSLPFGERPCSIPELNPFFMMLNLRSLTLTASFILSATISQAAITYEYSFEDRIGSGNPLTNDNWTGASVGSWVAQNQNGLVYARNQSGSDNRLFRANDGGFNFSIPANTTMLIIEIDSRTASFWEAGISSGSTPLLQLGADFNNSDDYFILGNGSRITDTTNLAAGDTNTTIRLEYDLVNGTADFIFDPLGANTLVFDDVALTTGDLSTADGLTVRAGNQFSGAGNIRITVIPEPSCAALLGLAGLSLILRRRR